MYAYIYAHTHTYVPTHKKNLVVVHVSAGLISDYCSLYCTFLYFPDFL